MLKEVILKFQDAVDSYYYGTFIYFEWFIIHLILWRERLSAWIYRLFYYSTAKDTRLFWINLTRYIMDLQVLKTLTI